MNQQIDQKAYLVGGGIASLAAAVFLIRDGKMSGENITIFEQLQINGGSCDGSGNPEEGYLIRGGRMLNHPTYECTWALLRSIPSLENPNKSVRQEIIEFNNRIKTNAKARLIDKKQRKIDVTKMGFNCRDRKDMIKLFITPEDKIQGKRIDDWFANHFFETNFWTMWATTFSFQKWHSLIELRRYMIRFIHEFPRIHTLKGIARTPYNQYDSIILPIIKWLRKNNVQFETNCRVNHLEFQDDKDSYYVNQINYIKDGIAGNSQVKKQDIVLVTNGCMTEGFSIGSMTKAPVIHDKEVGGAWELWEDIATGRPWFGNPKNFDGNVEQSLWESFTVTLKNSKFLEKIERFTGNKPGTGALMTFKDSNWLMSIVIAYQPHFLNQPENVKVFWGYSLFPEKAGNYIKKRMCDCTGEEILEELCYHLGMIEEIPILKKEANCIPCMMPFVTSQFMTRNKEDRPKVVPEGSKNLGFIGQFCEIPEDVVFTVEYSIRSAQMAVYELLGISKSIPPIHHYDKNKKVIVQSLKTLLK